MTALTPKKFTIDEYHRLIELGFFIENDRIELIRGELMQIVSKGTPHTVCGSILCRQLDRLLGDRAVIRGQHPITLPNDSEPEPDVVVAFGKDEDYLIHHPYPEDILLVIEISDSTLTYDQKEKLEIYAEAEINRYWIVNLNARSSVRMLSKTIEKQSRSFFISKSANLSTRAIHFNPWI